MNFYVVHFQLSLYGDTEFIFSNIWLVKFYLRRVITNYQANLYLILVTFLFELYIIMWIVFTWNVHYMVFTVYHGELRLNKVSEVEDHVFCAGADSWYPISLEILTIGVSDVSCWATYEVNENTCPTIITQDDSITINELANMLPILPCSIQNFSGRQLIVLNSINRLN